MGSYSRHCILPHLMVSTGGGRANRTTPPVNKAIPNTPQMIPAVPILHDLLNPMSAHYQLQKRRQHNRFCIVIKHKKGFPHISCMTVQSQPCMSTVLLTSYKSTIKSSVYGKVSQTSPCTLDNIDP